MEYRQTADDRRTRQRDMLRQIFSQLAKQKVEHIITKGKQTMIKVNDDKKSGLTNQPL